MDVSDPGDPRMVAFVRGPDSLWRDMKVYRDFAYAISEGGNGIQVMDMSGIDDGVVTLVREVNDIDTGRTHTVAIDTESGFLYRCGGRSNGLRIYSLEDPAKPTLVSEWQDKYVHECQVLTYSEGDYAGRQIAFVCGGFNGGWSETGLDILDVTDKANITKLGRVTWANPGYSHQCWLSPDRKWAFLNDELDETSYGLPSTTHVINLEDLSNPYHAGTFTNNNTAIDHNLYTKDDMLFCANYRSGLRVWQYTDPLNPKEIAYFDTWPGDDLPQFNGLWNNYPYLPSGIIIGSDIERGMFVWRLMRKGDMNCDGVVDFEDIDPFVLAITRGEEYDALFPDCDRANADVNEDGEDTFDDIDPFVQLLIND
jgi:choice-of-anchor B domain-containing protein